MDDSSDDLDDLCSVETPEPLRMFLVTIFGTGVASISLIFNVFLFLILIVNPQHRKSHLIYLLILALIDVFLSASYILMFPVNVSMDFFESDFLVLAWYSYVRPMMPICHIMITSSALLITAAAFERYLTISKIRQQFPTSWRLTISSIALFFALAAKGPMYFEMEVVKRDNCTGLTEWAIARVEWSDEEPYSTVYKFWFRNIISTFFPFFLSLYFNIKIVTRLARQQTGARLFGYATSEHRKNIRAATRMLVLITATYLGSNLPNVIITAWEFIDPDSLYTPAIRPYYTYITDTVSLLTVCASASRLPIYYLCNARIRREVNTFLLRTCNCNKELRKFSRDNIATMRYFNTGNGFIVYKPQVQSSGGSEADAKCMIGTSFDKVVLSVAIGGFPTKASIRRSKSAIT